MTLTLITLTGQLADRYQSYAGLPCDDDVVQPAVISLHPVVIFVADDVVGQGHLGKVLPHSLEAGYLLLGGLLVPIPLQGHLLQGHCLLHAPATHLLLPTAFTDTHLLRYCRTSHNLAALSQDHCGLVGTSAQ